MRPMLTRFLMVALLASPAGDTAVRAEDLPGSSAPEIDPGRGACEYGIAVAFQGELARAESVFVGLLARSPGDARALTNLGNLNLIRGEADVALAFYRRAAETDTTDAGILLDQATALLLLGDDEAAANQAAAGAARAGGVHEAARLLGLRAAPEDHAPKGAAATRVNPEEILSLLRAVASRVPADSLHGGAGAESPERGTPGDARSRKPPVWRAAGARAGAQDVAAVLYWKR